MGRPRFKCDRIKKRVKDWLSITDEERAKIRTRKQLAALVIRKAAKKVLRRDK